MNDLIDEKSILDERLKIKNVEILHLYKFLDTFMAYSISYVQYFKKENVDMTTLYFFYTCKH